MKARTKTNLATILISVILAFIAVFDFFKTPIETLRPLLQNIGLHHEDWAKVALILISASLIFIVIVLVRYIWHKIHMSSLLGVEAVPVVTLASDASGERIHDFQSLRVQANKSIFVMGVGVTYFSSDLSLLDNLLKKNLRVRVLTMSPDVIAKSRSARSRKGTPDIMLSEGLFDKYFCREGYHKDLRASIDRLKKYAMNASSGPLVKDIELRVYDYFVPLNFTAIDESDNGKILLEFCMPFSDQRLRMLFSNREHADLYERILTTAEEIWSLSNPIVSKPEEE